MSLDDIGRFIQTVGFPVAVAAFVLVRLNGKVGKLADAMVELGAHLKENTDATREAVEHLRTPPQPAPRRRAKAG